MWRGITGATSITYAANTAGSYHVKVLDIKGCVDESVPVELTITSLHDMGESARLSAYPNPNSGNFSLVISSSEIGIFDYQMMDVSGKVIKLGSFNKVSKTHRMEFQLNQGSGVYFLQITNGEKTSVLKILK